MRIFLATFTLLLSSSLTLAQSGRKLNEPKTTPPTEQQQTPVLVGTLSPTVRRLEPQEYRCGKDGNHTRITPSEATFENVLTAKMVDRRVVFRSKPRPSYTLEARRNRKQGFVILKLVLSESGDVGRVRVLRGLPFGLTESAIKAACKMEFKPAIKDGQSVSQWVTAEYVFRLPDSRLFRP